MEAVARKDDARYRPRAGSSPAGGVLERVATVTCKVADVDEAVVLLGERDALMVVARHGRTPASAVGAWQAHESPLAEENAAR